MKTTIQPLAVRPKPNGLSLRSILNRHSIFVLQLPFTALFILFILLPVAVALACPLPTSMPSKCHNGWG